MMAIDKAVLTCLRKRNDFTGRASRAEYWWFALFSWLTGTIGGGAWVVAPWMGYLIMGLGVFIAVLPSIAVLVRRLHDIGRSGAYFFIVLVPVVGLLLLIVALASPGTQGPNSHGSPPVGFELEAPG
jgi:uncharacterized membrane protein YhaH (DUF805 family)